MASVQSDFPIAAAARLRRLLAVTGALAGLCLLPSDMVMAQSNAQKAKSVAAAAAKKPKPIRTEIRPYDNWSVTCEEFAHQPNKPVCSAVLKIVDRKTRRTLFAWLLAKQAKTGQVVGLIQTPTGVLVAPGISFQFAQGRTRKYGYTSCEPGRCSTIVPLGLAFRKEIGRAKSGKITIVSTAGRRIHFQVAPAGFAKAYSAVLAIK